MTTLMRTLNLHECCRVVDNRHNVTSSNTASKRTSASGEVSADMQDLPGVQKAEPSAEELVLALQCLRDQLEPKAGLGCKVAEPTLTAPACLPIYSYPTLDWGQIERSRKLMGGLIDATKQKTRLEQEISLATSKVSFWLGEGYYFRHEIGCALHEAPAYTVAPSNNQATSAWAKLSMYSPCTYLRYGMHASCWEKIGLAWFEWAKKSTEQCIVIKDLLVMQIDSSPRAPPMDATLLAIVWAGCHRGVLQLSASVHKWSRTSIKALKMRPKIRFKAATLWGLAAGLITLPSLKSTVSRWTRRGFPYITTFWISRIKFTFKPESLLDKHRSSEVHADT